MKIKTITIDAGVNGGIALLDESNNISVVKMPENYIDVIDFFGSLEVTNDCKVYLEQLHCGSGAQGVKKSIKVIWSQSGNYTNLLCAVYVAKLQLIEVSPMKWMGLINGSGQRPKDYKERKKWLKVHAQKTYPKIKVTDWNADCLAMLSVLERGE